MSVVIVGGHDRMVSQYVKICKSFNCKAKVFTQMTADFGKQIGAPDLLVLFTSTVSHKMIRTAVDGAKGSRTEVVRCHTSSKTVSGNDRLISIWFEIFFQIWYSSI